MELKGYMDIEIETESTIESLRLDGSEFSWEEGGEHSPSFLFIYFDNDERFQIDVQFTTYEGNILHWHVSTNSKQVSIVNDELEVPEPLLNFDPDEYF